MADLEHLDPLSQGENDTNENDTFNAETFAPVRLDDADDAESDEYDPSFIADDGSQLLEPIPAETTAAEPLNGMRTHALPPRPDVNMSPSLTQSLHAPIPTQLSETREGFERDEDELEDEDRNTDTFDIYDGSINGSEEKAAQVVSSSDVAVDSPASAKQANGVAENAHSHGASTSASEVVSSNALLTNVVPPQRAASSTPLPAANEPPIPASSIPKSVTNLSASTASTASKGRLAHDIIGILQDRIQEDPRGDVDAWLQLVEEFKSRNKDDDVRKTYDELLKLFPLYAEQWCAFVRWEEQQDHKYAMENIFKESLTQNLNVELWSIYINYVRRRYSMTTGDVTKSFRVIEQSFQFVLSNVGMDPNSGKIWQDYIDFLKTSPGVIGGNDWQDKAKADTLRSAYQRAIAVPTSALNVLWKEYDIFETQSNKANGRKNLQERSPAYMTARSANTQLQNLTKDLDRTSRPKLPPLPGSVGHDVFLQQVSLWRQWIQWEKDDNLVIKDEDQQVYQTRILFVYKQALAALYYWPEMWFEAVEFCLSNNLKDLQSKSDVGPKLLADGVRANPESSLLAYKMADNIEMTTTNDDSVDGGVSKRFAQVRAPFDNLLKALYALVKKCRSRELEEVQHAETELAAALVALDSTHDAATDEEDPSTSAEEIKRTAEQQIMAIKEASEQNIMTLKDTISCGWIALIRAGRRIQGKKGSRDLFAEARAGGQLTSRLYLEVALIEHNCYGEKVVVDRIFDKGLKLYPNDAQFAYSYLRHLISTKDIINARSVFETAIGRLSGNPNTIHATRPLFGLLHEFETKYGDLAQVMRLETRMQELMPGQPAVQLFADRYTSSNFDPTAVIPPISRKQNVQSSFLPPPIEVQTLPQAANSPITRLIDSINTSSPKRPFPTEDFDEGPRKLARAESPLKGAAGRRMNQQQHQRNPNGLSISSTQPLVIPTPPLPNQVLHLLSIMPKASTYIDARFDAGKLVDLLREIRIPTSLSMPPAQQPPPQFQQHAPPTPSWAGNFAPTPQPGMMPPAAYLPPQSLGQAQYGTGPYHYS